MVKRLPAMWETWARSLGWQDPLEEGMATHSSILAWRVPMNRGAWQATVHGVSESDTTEQLTLSVILIGVKWYLALALICISPWCLVILSTFSCMSSLEKNVYLGVLPIFKLECLLLYCWGVSSLHILDRPLMDYMVYRYPLPFHRLSFDFVDCFFTVQKLLSLM